MLLFRSSTVSFFSLPREHCPAFTNAVAFAQQSSRLAAVLYENGLFFYKFILQCLMTAL